MLLLLVASALVWLLGLLLLRSGMLAAPEGAQDEAGFRSMTAADLARETAETARRTAERAAREGDRAVTALEPVRG